MTTEHSSAQSFVDTCGIEYTATFIPMPQSRNKASKYPTLNWRVKLQKNGIVLETDYQQGCGHIPHYNYQFSTLVVYDKAVKEACKTGKSRLLPGKKNGYDACQEDRLCLMKVSIPPPTLVDVLYCLVTDAEVLEYANFETWASEFDYNPDSRQAERVYKDCLQTALTLRKMIDLDKAREAFQDY